MGFLRAEFPSLGRRKGSGGGGVGGGVARDPPLSQMSSHSYSHVSFPYILHTQLHLVGSSTPMKVLISEFNIPIGYSTPPFPSLYWPLGHSANEYEALFLYYSKDIWRFTVYWALVFYALAYGIAGVCACVNMFWRMSRQNQTASHYSLFQHTLPILVLVLYLFVGLLYAFLSGSVIGLVLNAIYRAGSLTMTTWIPFCFGIALMTYHIASSYSTSLMLM